jgi:MoxR-like ATPase
MEKLFMVLATQNPVEQEGTYPLPEAQMDRFLMKVLIGYPDVESEKEILRLVRSESKETHTSYDPIDTDVIFNAREEIKDIKVAETAEQYIVDLINATRFPNKYSEKLKEWIAYGASPRGTIALEKCSRVMAWLNQRDYVTSDDIRAVAHDVLRHRLILSYEASADGVSADEVIDELLNAVAI